jgi:hypothetical protein
VSSVARAPEGASFQSRPATRLVGLRPPSLSVDFFVGAAVAAAFGLVSFVASGGTDLATNTWVQVALIALGVVAAIAVALWGARAAAWGATTLLLFAALAALSYASIAWSVQPALSWLEANRTLSYLAAFAVALIAGRVTPNRWRGVLGAVAAATTVVSGYALVVKVFPATFDPLDALGRLSLPFGYWNATGLMAALGVPACLWAGARRDPAPLLRSLAAPAIALLVAALILSYSRGAIAAAVVGMGLWFAVVPLRLRGSLMLLIGGAGAAAIAAWALAHHALSSDNAALAARTSAGHSFGVVLLVVLALTTAAGVGATLAMDRVELSVRLRRRIGTVLVAAAALIPLAGVVALAESSRGLTGEVSHIWNTVTNPSGVVGDKPGRLAALSNSRPHYWSVALKIGEHHLVAGTGALGFATAQDLYTNSGVWNSVHSHASHAHGYLFETFADFGLIGLLLSVALLVAWGVAAARALGLQTPRPPPDQLRAVERVGLLTMLAVVVTFGVHSLIDWTWFIPGTAIVGLVCAGWLAGRGPLEAPVGRRSRSRQLLRSPSAAIAIASALVIAVAAIWVTLQPLRSSDANSAALAAAIRGDAGTALTDARAAAAENPVSIDPLNLMAKVYAGLGDQRAARHELLVATTRQPSNPAAWEALGCYEIGQHDTTASTADLHRAVILEPGNVRLQADPAAYCATLAGVVMGNG